MNQDELLKEHINNLIPLLSEDDLLLISMLKHKIEPKKTISVLFTDRELKRAKWHANKIMYDTLIDNDEWIKKARKVVECANCDNCPLSVTGRINDIYYQGPDTKSKVCHSCTNRVNMLDDQIIKREKSHERKADKLISSDVIKTKALIYNITRKLNKLKEDYATSKH